jgi:very-short-patch-repair endonuclease
MFTRVYAIADPDLIPFCREAAALLSLGTDAVLSSLTAAAGWRIASAPRDVIHVTVLGNPKPRPGVHIHRITALDPKDIRTHANLRLTAPARTIIDCAPTINVERAIADAMANRIMKPYELKEALDRAPMNHPGVPIVRAHVVESGPVLTRSVKERKLRRLLKAANLPMPQTNTELDGLELDFYWPEHRLNVEVDAYGTHGSRKSFESDRRRDQRLAMMGITVLRFTARQLDDEPLRVIAAIAQALAQRAPKAA